MTNSQTTASAYRSGRGHDIPVTVGDGQTFLCRRPDLDDLMFRGLVPLPLVRAFFEDMGPVVAGDPASTVEHLIESGGAPRAAELVDEWIVLAVRAPRVVKTEADAGQDVLWIGEIPLLDKLAIFSATFNMGEAARRAAASAFPARADGAPTGSGGAPVSDAPLVDVEHR